MNDAIGCQKAVDTETPPTMTFPWHTLCALLLVYFIGINGMHWVYVIPIFWVLLSMDERRRRTTWARMKRDLVVTDQLNRESKKIEENYKGDTVTWLNQLLRATWPM